MSQSVASEFTQAVCDQADDAQADAGGFERGITNMIRSLLVAAAMIVVVEPPAFACTPVRVVPDLPAGLLEKDVRAFLDAYYRALEAPVARAASEYNRQEQMWREADSVVLVRITAFNRRNPQSSRSEWRARVEADPTLAGATLEPVSWLKGQGQSTPFRVRERGGGDCSVAAGWDSRPAEVGNVFVAYFKAGPLSDNTLLDGLVPESVVEPTVRALLALRQ